MLLESLAFGFILVLDLHVLESYKLEGLRCVAVVVACLRGDILSEFKLSETDMNS